MRYNRMLQNMDRLRNAITGSSPRDCVAILNDLDRQAIELRDLTDREVSAVVDPDHERQINFH